MATRDFLLEIGSEEIPAAPLDSAIKQLQFIAADALKGAGLAHGEIKVISSPRRLALYVSDIADSTEEKHEVMRGPAASIAFDESGNPTKAAIGFAKGKGLEASDLTVKEEDGKKYVFAQVDIDAKPAQPLLAEISENIIKNISWPRSQRWGSEHVTYVRPVRWLVCMFGDEVIDISYGDVKSSNKTYGHRVLAPGEHEIANVVNYERVLKSAYVLDHDARAEVIRDGVKKIEEAENVRVDMPSKIFNEVVNVCEWPSVLVGHFDDEFLDVPHEIICESMLSHQRYFPIYDADNNLTTAFVVVGNAKSEVAETVIDGNERVVRARLDDAKFFFEEDLKKPLEGYLEKLKSVVFQEKLGTVYQKSERIEAIAREFASAAGTSEDVKNAARAAHLAKADLVTQAVVEFTNQQGVMGAYYAKASGENDEVARAIEQQYRPRFAGDEIPEGPVGVSISVADKLDTICGMFAISEPPTGSSDPFAQRRGAIGIIHMLKEYPAVHLVDLIDCALKSYEKQGLKFSFDEVKASVIEFFAGRLSAMAKDEKISPDTVSAILAVGVVDPLEFFSRCTALDKARQGDTELFEDLATAYERANNLRDTSLGTSLDTKLMSKSEKSLYDACVTGKDAVDKAILNKDYAAALSELAGLRAPIDAFFEEVLIMDEDMSLRENRLKLLNLFVQVFTHVADFSKLQ